MDDEEEESEKTEGRKGWGLRETITDAITGKGLRSHVSELKLGPGRQERGRDWPAAHGYGRAQVPSEALSLCGTSGRKRHKRGAFVSFGPHSNS